MNKTEYIGKLNALYVGEKNCLEELITAYDEKDKEIERLNNIIKEVREYAKNDDNFFIIDDYSRPIVEEIQEELLEILDKVEENI